MSSHCVKQMRVDEVLELAFPTDFCRSLSCILLLSPINPDVIRLIRIATARTCVAGLRYGDECEGDPVAPPCECWVILLA